MKGTVVLTVVAWLALGLAAPAEEIRVASLTGWVSDDRCRAKHTKPGGEECVKKCLQGDPDVSGPEGEARRMVFVTDRDHNVWIVKNPGILRGYEGQRVRISGRVNKEARTVHVTQVAAVARKKTQ